MRAEAKIALKALDAAKKELADARTEEQNAKVRLTDAEKYRKAMERNLGSGLRAMRAALGLAAKDVAHGIGISAALIYVDLEDGVGPFNPETAADAEKYLVQRAGQIE